MIIILENTNNINILNRVSNTIPIIKRDKIYKLVRNIKYIISLDRDNTMIYRLIQEINSIYSSYITTATKARVYIRLSKMLDRGKLRQITNNILISLNINNLEY